MLIAAAGFAVCAREVTDALAGALLAAGVRRAFCQAIIIWCRLFYFRRLKLFRERWSLYLQGAEISRD